MSRIRPWQVWLFDLGEPVCHEQGGVRPGVVAGSTLHCRFPIGMALVVPLTTRERPLDHHVPVFSPDSGLDRVSYACTESLVSLSTNRLVRPKPLGSLVESERLRVSFWLQKMLSKLAMFVGVTVPARPASAPRMVTPTMHLARV